jgi:hypothetical protein
MTTHQVLHVWAAPRDDQSCWFPGCDRGIYDRLVVRIPWLGDTIDLEALVCSEHGSATPPNQMTETVRAADLQIGDAIRIEDRVIVITDVNRIEVPAEVASADLLIELRLDSEGHLSSENYLSDTEFERYVPREA